MVWWIRIVYEAYKRRKETEKLKKLREPETQPYRKKEHKSEGEEEEVFTL